MPCRVIVRRRWPRAATVTSPNPSTPGGSRRPCTGTWPRPGSKGAGWHVEVGARPQGCEPRGRYGTVKGEGMQPMVRSQAKILVVDDDAKNVRLMEVLLRPRGYEVVSASNGAAALQL